MAACAATQWNRPATPYEVLVQRQSLLILCIRRILGGGRFNGRVDVLLLERFCSLPWIPHAKVCAMPLAAVPYFVSARCHLLADRSFLLAP